MADTYAEEQQAIMGRLNANWEHAEAAVAWPNTHFDPGGVAYIQPVVNRQEAFNVDLAPTKRIRHPGLLTVNVRVPLNEGDGRALELADDVVAIYRNVTFSGITFRAPTVRDIGAEGPWYRVQVDCPFWRDSIH